MSELALGLFHWNGETRNCKIDFCERVQYAAPATIHRNCLQKQVSALIAYKAIWETELSCQFNKLSHMSLGYAVDDVAWDGQNVGGAGI